MPKCKKCGSENAVKCGTARGKQRYQCKDCGYHFITGDGRLKSAPFFKHVCALLADLGCTQAEIAALLSKDPSQISRFLHTVECCPPAYTDRGEGNRGKPMNMGGKFYAFGAQDDFEIMVVMRQK